MKGQEHRIIISRNVSYPSLMEHIVILRPSVSWDIGGGQEQQQRAIRHAEACGENAYEEMDGVLIVLYRRELREVVPKAIARVKENLVQPVHDAFEPG